MEKKVWEGKKERRKEGGGGGRRAGREREWGKEGRKPHVGMFLARAMHLRGVAGAELGGWDGRGAVCGWGALGCCGGEEDEAEEDGCLVHDCGVVKWLLGGGMVFVFSGVKASS